IQYTVSNSTATDTPNTAAHHATSRKLALLKKLRSVTQAVSGAAHRVDELAIEVAVHLRAQAADVGLDHARARVEVKLPDILEQHGAGHHLPGVAHQVLEQLELLLLQLDAATRPRDRALQPVHLEVGHAQQGFLARDGRAARERVHAREELGEG